MKLSLHLPGTRPGPPETHSRPHEPPFTPRHAAHTPGSAPLRPASGKSSQGLPSPLGLVHAPNHPSLRSGDAYGPLRRPLRSLHHPPHHHRPPAKAPRASHLPSACSTPLHPLRFAPLPTTRHPAARRGSPRSGDAYAPLRRPLRKPHLSWVPRGRDTSPATTSPLGPVHTPRLHQDPGGIEDPPPYTPTVSRSARSAPGSSLLSSVPADLRLLKQQQPPRSAEIHPTPTTSHHTPADVRDALPPVRPTRLPATPTLATSLGHPRPADRQLAPLGRWPGPLARFSRKSVC